jgi:hypothetical protein
MKNSLARDDTNRREKFRKKSGFIAVVKNIFRGCFRVIRLYYWFVVEKEGEISGCTE